MTLLPLSFDAARHCYTCGAEAVVTVLSSRDYAQQVWECENGHEHVDHLNFHSSDAPEASAPSGGLLNDSSVSNENRSPALRPDVPTMRAVA